MPEEEGTVVNNDAVENTAPTEATTEENNSSTAEESTEQVEESQQETEAAESTEETDAEETDVEKPKRGADARKDQLKGQIDDANTEIRDLVAEKNNVFAHREAIRRQVEQANAQAYKPASSSELLEQVNPDTGDYYTRLEAQVEAMRQDSQVRDYNNRVADAQMGIEYESQKALQDFPMFNERSPLYNEKLAAEVSAILASSLQIDQNSGQITGTSIPIYQLYKSHAMAANSGKVNAETTAQKNVEKMLSNVDRTPGGAGKTKSFEQMSLKEQEAHLRRKGHDV